MHMSAAANEAIAGKYVDYMVVSNRFLNEHFISDIYRVCCLDGG